MFSKAISIKHYFWDELLPLITNFWLEKNANIYIYKLKKAPKHYQKVYKAVKVFML